MVRRTLAIACIVASGLVACTPDSIVGEPPVEPEENSPLLRCAEPGISLQTVWRVENLHGAIRKLVTNDTGTLIAVSADGSVKQWDIGISSSTAPLERGFPSYGEPFAHSENAIGDVCFDNGSMLVGGGESGNALFWGTGDALLAETLLVSESAIAAVAVAPSGTIAFADVEYSGNMKTLGPFGALSNVPQRSLWFVMDLAYTSDVRLLAAGDNYGEPGIEFAQGGDPKDSWVGLSSRDRDLATPVREFALVDEERFVVGITPDALLVFDTSNLAEGPVNVHRPATEELALAARDDVAATIGSDGYIRLFEVFGLGELASAVVDAPTAIAIDAAAERVIVGSASGSLTAFACR